jgi:hypothetical protein
VSAGRLLRTLSIGCLALGVLIGCASDPHKGYVLGSTYDAGIRTVSVPVFRNGTFTPGIEQTLTDAITKEIMRSTPWRVVSSGNADTELAGWIGEYRLLALTRTPGTGLVQEQALSMQVNFTWRDNRDGTVRLQRERFGATTTFIPSPGINGEPGERIEIGEREAIEELARAIVNEMRSDF